MRFLADSSASTMQAYFVLYFPMLRQVSLLLWHIGILQGIAAGIGTSNFPRAFEFFIIRINEINTTQPSGIVELWFLDSPLSLFFAFRRIGHNFPDLRPQSVWSGGRLFSSRSPPGPCNSIRWFFIQYSESCGTCPRITSKEVSVVLVTPMYFSGTRNDSSLGT